MNRSTMLKQAADMVGGHREEDYGSPEDNFAVISELWSVYLAHGVTAYDVAAMMALLKLARLRRNPGHVDSWVDLAGYAACGCEIATGRGDDGRES